MKMLKFFFLKKNPHGDIAKIICTYNFFFPKKMKLLLKILAKNSACLEKDSASKIYSNSPKLLLIICAITLLYFRMTLHFLHSDTF